MADRTPYQEKIIKRYYQNRDEIMWQKLAELATDLYLAEGRKREQIWKRVVTAMNNLKIPQVRINDLVESDNPSLVVALVESQMKKK
ncbi:MAG: hypothetical protein LBQ54_13780 [Planctomycetaceae bacterium]|jgi:hypothetical protein|nr:hypothetical protein [Planctomycetaceae bacterium]